MTAIPSSAALVRAEREQQQQPGREEQLSAQGFLLVLSREQGNIVSI